VVNAIRARKEYRVQLDFKVLKEYKVLLVHRE
jgi:hypothetical protein